MCREMSGRRTIAVTGRMGGGKTTLCRHFADKGYPVYRSDDRAKALYVEVPGLAEELEGVFGLSLHRADGSFDTTALAEAVFSDAGRLAKLESVVHPLVYEDFVRWREANDCGLAFMESAIFLYKPLFYPLADAVIEVKSPEGEALRRVMARDHVTHGEVARRMGFQRGVPGRLPDATVVNDGSLDTLYARGDEALAAILKRLGGLV